jgi:hypothetical protein
MQLRFYSDSLGLTSIKDRQWHLEKASAIKNVGLTEGLDWMAGAIMGTAPAPAAAAAK